MRKGSYAYDGKRYSRGPREVTSNFISKFRYFCLSPISYDCIRIGFKSGQN